MNQLIKWIKAYQTSKEDYLFEKIVKETEKIVYSHLQKVTHSSKEDVYQEMLIGLYKLLQTFEIRENEESSKYLNLFFQLCGEDIKKEENWQQEYQYFCNEKQFIKCLNQRFHSVYIDFLRRLNNEMSLEICSFDIEDDKNSEIRDKSEEQNDEQFQLDYSQENRHKKEKGSRHFFVKSFFDIETDICQFLCEQ